MPYFSSCVFTFRNSPLHYKSCPAEIISRHDLFGTAAIGQVAQFCRKHGEDRSLFRVDAALASINTCIASDTTAGHLDDNVSVVAIGNSKGLYTYNKQATANSR